MADRAEKPQPRVLPFLPKKPASAPAPRKPLGLRIEITVTKPTDPPAS